MALPVPVEAVLLNKLSWPEVFATLYAEVPSQGKAVSISRWPPVAGTPGGMCGARGFGFEHREERTDPQSGLAFPEL